MMRIAMVAVMMAGCASSGFSQTTLATSTALLVCDGMDTVHAAGTGWMDGHEGNPIMGSHPSVTVVGAYFLGVIATNTALWEIIPDRYRWIIPSMVSAVQVNTIVGNAPYTGVCGM